MENKREEILSRLEAIKQEKKQLKKQLNDLHSLEVGKWYKDPTQFGYIYFITEIKDYAIKGYGIIGGKWDDDFGLGISVCKSDRPATDKEVETALIAEAKKRGFKEGVKIISYDGNNYNLTVGDDGMIYYTNEVNNLCVGDKSSGIILFKDGKWSTIVKPKTVHIPGGDYTETQLKDILNNRF